jgi:hypothetical protein
VLESSNLQSEDGLSNGGLRVNPSHSYERSLVAKRQNDAVGFKRLVSTAEKVAADSTSEQIAEMGELSRANPGSRISGLIQCH